jgi:hypothetical protein
VFPRWSDLALRGALGALAVLALVLIGGPMIYVRTPYAQDRSTPIAQPVQFDHRHHVHDLGVACLYCHGDAARSAYAGVPATEVCMGCHAQVWPESAKLAPVRASFFSDTPIAWQRVHDLPDFVYFDHSVHVQNHVQCEQCHGDVASMPLVHKVRSFTMGFCLDCHRDPAQHVPGYSPSRSIAAQHAAAVNTNPLISCSACHR